MRPPSLHKQYGISLFEAVFGFALISVLITVFMNRVVSLSVDIERESMNHTLNIVHGAIKVEHLAYALKGRENDLIELHEANPMTLLAEAPAHYLGEYNNPDPAQMPERHWYFDMSERTLVYRVNNASYFLGGAEGAAHARFQVQVDYLDANENGKHDNGEAYTDISLVALDPYSWSQ